MTFQRNILLSYYVTPSIIVYLYFTWVIIYLNLVRHRINTFWINILLISEEIVLRRGIMRWDFTCRVERTGSGYIRTRKCTLSCRHSYALRHHLSSTSEKTTTKNICKQISNIYLVINFTQTKYSGRLFKNNYQKYLLSNPWRVFININNY